MSQSSRELLDFSDYYRQKAHTTQRTGPLPGTIPHLQQLDDMMKHSDGVRESLSRLRQIIVSQRQVEEEASRAKAAKIVAEASPLYEQQSEPADTRGDGGFAGADSKKRRGVSFADFTMQELQITDDSMQRAAPPGKCHSCNRVDTPEWRRGPDGARTLCNACGLHYAKLTRKSGTGNVAGKAPQQGSNLRPKDDTPVT